MSIRPYGAMAVLCMGLFCFAPSLRGQNGGAGGHVGVPQGWSDRSLVFSLNGLSQYPNLMDQEPRIRHQVMQRFQELNPEFFRDFTSNGITADNPSPRDWNVNFVRGRVPDSMYPAKFSFNPGAPPDCTNDYVVFGLNVVGAKGKQANLVAFNNLYSGPGGICGAAPTVLFAYDVSTQTGGKVNLSPVISLDGTKIAFVESATGQTIFHVLTWVAGEGGITTAVVPSNMTSLQVSATATSTTSAPWVDYTNDVAYAGVDGGLMYKINGVFNSTPALAGGAWPVTVSGGHKLTPPVLDSQLGLLMIGSANGNLYSVNSTTGVLSVLVVGAAGKTSPGIIPPPVVDITNGTTFVVDANDGTSAVLVEVDTATLTQIAKARIGLGSVNKTALTLGQPAFTNDYYNNPSAGQVRLCGTGAADTTPWQYGFGFVGRTMKTTAAFSQQLLISTAAVCTNWTEFFNPNVGAGTDFFFFGLTQDCTGAGTSGCVVAATTEGGALLTADVPGGPSGIVIDNYSTAGQASSIYLSSETGSTGYKFTQNGLQ
ncbi:MAG TPA: hypothetical protein VMI10_21810 [Terriglobales bacterium]|nr:hypothetical protein [Terriglobales bacterium]